MSDRLTAAMNRLAAQTAHARPPEGMEPSLLAEFDRAHRRRKGWPRMVGPVAAIAAVAASIAAVLIFKPGTVLKSPDPLPAASSASADIRESDQPFVPIPYVAPLAPYERAEIVRMELPVSALIAAGLPMRTADQGARAEADVVVGQDGRARAVRLISISSFN